MDAPQAIYEDVNRFDDFKIKQNVADGIDLITDTTGTYVTERIEEVKNPTLAIWDKRRDIYVTEGIKGAREAQIIFQRNFGVFIEGKMYPEDRK